MQHSRDALPLDLARAALARCYAELDKIGHEIDALPEAAPVRRNGVPVEGFEHGT